MDSRFQDSRAYSWLFAATAGIIFVGIGFSVLHILLQFAVHTVAYTVSDGYQVHVDKFGGYSGYLETQLLPRAGYTLFSNWYTEIFYGAAFGLVIRGILTVYQQPALRWLVLTIVFTAWVGWREARFLVRDPFWSVLDIVLWFLCIYTLQYIMIRWGDLPRAGGDRDA